MADKNVSSAKELKTVESKKSKKEKLSIKKVLTIVVIAVLALLMVGGFSYAITMVNQAKSEKQNAWGSYNGEAINLEPNSVFYNTLMNDSNFQTAYLTGDYNTLLNSYMGAYQQQVVFTAISQEAKKAGIQAPQELVEDLIIASGVFSDENGNYSADIFNSTSEADKLSINTYYTNYYPYQQVVNDLQSTIVSKQEVDFVSEVSGWTRSFQYFTIDYNVYPDEKAAAFGAENATLFAKADISVISCATEEDATAAYEALNLGSAWADVVTTYSKDSYASNEGKVGTVMMFAIVGNMTEPADIEKVAALEEGAYTAPVAGPNGYVIYKLDTKLETADFKDAETLASVKYYINANALDDMSSYVDTAVGIATAQAQVDFDKAAEACNATIVTIDAASDNVGNSSFIGGLNYYDEYGYLAKAAEDKETSRELFTADEGYVTGAIAVEGLENTYLIAKVTGIDMENEAMTGLTQTLYGYYAATNPAYDRMYAVFSSDKYVDNFYQQFFSAVL